MSHLHSDAKPPLNFFGALFSGVLGGLWATGPLRAGGTTADDLLYVAAGVALTAMTVAICWRWGDDSIGTVPAVAVPFIFFLPGSSKTVLLTGPRDAALVIPASMLVLVSVPFLWDGVGRLRGPGPPLAEASPRSWVKRVLAVREIDLTLAEAVAGRADASKIADRLVETVRRPGGSIPQAAAYLGRIDPARLAALLDSPDFIHRWADIAQAGAIAGIDGMAQAMSRLAREHATAPEGLALATAAARFGDLEPMRAFVADFDEDKEVFHALVRAGVGVTPLLETLLLDAGASEERIGEVCSIARRLGPEMVPFLKRMASAASDPRVRAEASATLLYLR